MKFLLEHKGFLAAVCAAVLILALAVTSLVAGQGATPVSNLLGTVFRPLQSFASGVSQRIGGIYTAMFEMDALRDENEKLKIQLAEYDEDARAYDRMKEENERLKSLLGLKERKPELKFEQVDVISRDISNWARTLTLGRGSNVDIRVGNCVVSAEGYFVGVVKEVGLTWCVVNTAADTDMSTGVIFERTGITAVAEGEFSLMQKGLFKVSLLATDADVRQGDLVVTSGIGGLYPKDIAIGTVDEFREETTGLSSRAVVTPLADLDHLTQVFVIVSFDDGV